jgi:16S rRNA (uracil1498-N3)-methyltransferase
MDFSVQKAVELGVATISPLFTQHGVVSLKGERLESKQQHWQRVAISAAEQSGRAVVSRIATPMQLSEWIEEKSKAEQTKIVLQPQASQTFQDVPAPSGPVIVLIGPEGGLSEEELNLAKAAGFVGISLGPRILRAETATTAVMTIVQSMWGDLNMVVN